MSSLATLLSVVASASTLTDHLVVDTSLRIPTAKWAQTDDALSLEIKTACIGDTKRIAFQHDVFNFTCVSRHAGAVDTQVGDSDRNTLSLGPLGTPTREKKEVVRRRDKEG